MLGMLVPILAISLLLPVAASAVKTPEAEWTGQAILFDGVVFSETGIGVSATDRSPLKLSELADILRQDPKAIDTLIDALTNRLGERSQAWLTPERRQAFVDALRRADAKVLDGFPRLTAAQLLSAAKIYTKRKGTLPASTPPALFDLALPGAPTDAAPGAFLEDLGNGLHYGDVSSSGKGAIFGDSVIVAKALNLLADNDPVSPATRVRFLGVEHTSLRSLLAVLTSSDTRFIVRDMRYYANFGDLYYGLPGQLRDVETPVYVDTGLSLSNGSPLVVPVAHSHLEIEFRGKVKANLMFFFGIDGEAAFRANGTDDQHWVGGRTVGVNRGVEAEELLARAGDIRRHLTAKALFYQLPMGGYGPLGDCNDIHAFITGVSPYPMLREPRYFSGAGPLDQMSGSYPYDTVKAPDPRRLLESRPFDNIDDVPFPTVRDAYRAVAALSASIPSK